MSARNCLENHKKDAVFTDEIEHRFWTFTQHVFYCYDCKQTQIAAYITFHFRKNKKQAVEL